MKITVVGNGSREAAIGWRLEHDGHDVTFVTADEARQTDANLCVVGPEQPLVDGLADELRADGKRVFGPSAEHARLEGSKKFMKECLDQAGIQTAGWVAFNPGQESEYEQFVTESDWDGWVVKTDYLAAGKGVLVTKDRDEALADGLEKLHSGTVVVERTLAGREVSFFAICSSDGSFVFTPNARDYKRAYDDDQGPNTGGMGSYSPLDDGVSLEERTAIVEKLLGVLDGYVGVLFGGLMVTDEGDVNVLEFNVRFGDPETQSIMPRLDDDLGAILLTAASGEQLPEGELAASNSCVTVVLASEGYPVDPQVGRVITGIEDARAQADTFVFEAGVSKKDGALVTSGGRVLSVTALGDTLEQARERAYTAAKLIEYDGKHYRRDIAKVS